MGDNSFSHSIGIGRTYWPAKWCANAIPSVSTLLTMVNDTLMQSIIHVPVELELVALGTIPSAMALALAASIGLPSGVPMPFHWPPLGLHTTQNDN
jgi:hypothetical protein